jgi:hypothetical protein
VAAGRSALALELGDIATHLFATCIDLVHIYSSEIRSCGIFGTIGVTSQNLNSRKLVEVVRAMIAAMQDE